MRQKPNVNAALYALLRMGANKSSVTLNTLQFAKILGLSQQGASRRLLELEREGLVERRVSRRGQLVKLTPPAIEMLKEQYLEMKNVFEGSRGEKISLEGRVFTGFGEGGYYASLEGYRKELAQKLGFDPFPGTLNLRLSSPHDVEAKLRLESRSFQIPGFADRQRTYGGVKALPAKVNGSLDGAVLLIERTHYGPDVLEIVAPFDLRKRLKIKDGDRVHVEVLT